MGGMGPMWLLMILGLIGLWVLVVAALRWIIGPGRRAAPDPAVEALNWRFVRGEITAEEFRNARRLLENDR